jgi:hypothetical protein
MTQDTSRDQKGVWRVMVELFRRGGFRAFFAGYAPALARQGPITFVQMTLVELFRKALGLEYM